MNLHQPLHVLPGVGPKSAEKYAKLGIENLQDLLLYFPFRYEDFKTKQVLELEDGEKAVLSGQVVTPASVQYYGFKRNRLRFSLKQGEVVFAVNFFNQPYLADKIELGATLAVFGKWDRAKASLTGMKVLAQVEDDLQPVYRLAQGISQASLVKVIKTAFDQGLDLLLRRICPSLCWTNTNSCPVVRQSELCIFLRIWQNTSRPFAVSSLRNSFISKCNCRRSSLKIEFREVAWF